MKRKLMIMAGGWVVPTQVVVLLVLQKTAYKPMITDT